MKDINVPMLIGVAFVALILILSLKSSGLQSAVGIDCPEYKTNMEPGTIGLSNSWLAVDCNGDGAYEAYGYTGQVSYPSQRVVTGHITEISKDYYCFNSASGMILYIFQGTTTTAWVYKQDTAGYYLADLSCGDTPPPEEDPEPTGEVCVSDAEIPVIITKWISQEVC